MALLRIKVIVYRISIVFFVLFLSLITSDLVAEEAGIWVGLGGANLNTVKAGGLWGPGAQVGVRYQFSDFWLLSASLSGSHHFETELEDSADEKVVFPADTVMNASIRLRYLIDIVKYIPYFGIGPTFYFDVPSVEGAKGQANFGASLVLGMDWRYSRTSSMGVFGELHALASDLGRYPVYSLVGFRFLTHFRF